MTNKHFSEDFFHNISELDSVLAKSDSSQVKQNLMPSKKNIRELSPEFLNNLKLVIKNTKKINKKSRLLGKIVF